MLENDILFFAKIMQKLYPRKFNRAAFIQVGVFMSKPGFGQMYRKLSSKLLDLVVTPHVLGEVPTEPAIAETIRSPQSKKDCLLCITNTLHVVMPWWWMVKPVV